MRLTRRMLIAAGAVAMTPRPASGQARMLTGVNLAGLEFNDSRLPGRIDHDYVAPTAAELDYYRRCGARAVRLPFLWERLQPRLGGDFDSAYWQILRGLIEQTAARGMALILDPHQYGRRRLNGAQHVIGESEHVTSAHFAEFWGRLARQCHDAAHVIFGLQNEPHDQDAQRLASTHNGAIVAIRATGARHLILVPGGAWTGAHSWVSSSNGRAALMIRDPANHFAFEAHQYLDRDSSGSHAECGEGSGARLAPFTQWARENGKYGFLAEFGAASSEACATELSALLRHMADNRDVWIGWTYWAGGPWWPDDDPMTVEPSSLQRPRDRPQMAVLKRYFE